MGVTITRSSVPSRRVSTTHVEVVWSPDEDARLRRLYDRATFAALLAALPNRSADGIQQRAFVLRLSQQRPGDMFEQGTLKIGQWWDVYGDVLRVVDTHPYRIMVEWQRTGRREWLMFADMARFRGWTLLDDSTPEAEVS